MLVLLLLWVLQFTIFSGLGFLAINAYGHFSKQAIQIEKINTEIIVLFGFSLTAILVSYCSLFIPINWYLTAGFSILAFYGLFSNKKAIGLKIQDLKNSWMSFPIIFKGIFALTFLIALLSGSSYITHYDFGLFQLPYLNWVQNYPVVYGLANLDHRFGFNSHYFLTSGLFSFNHSVDTVICGLNSFLWMLLMSKFIFNMATAYKKELTETFLFNTILLGAFIYFTIIRLAGLSTDIINSILATFSLVLFLDIATKEIHKKQLIFLLIPILACITVTYKLSSALLIGLLLYLLYQKQTVKYFSYLAGAGLIIFIPFFIRNIILSGYLVFPFAALDLFDVDWKVPIDVLIGEQRNIKGWARLPYDASASDLPISEWFGLWFGNKGVIMKVFLIINALLIIPISFLIKKQNYLKAALLTVCLANLLFWFSQAPFPRYVYGILIVGFAITISIFITPLIEKNQSITKVIYKLLPLFLVATLGISSAAFVKNNLKISHLVLGQTCKVNELTNYQTDSDLVLLISKEKDNRCYNADFPCTHSPQKGLELIGKQLNSGFKVKSK